MTLKPHDNKRQLKKPSDLIKFEWEKRLIDKQKQHLKDKIKLSNKRGVEMYNSASDFTKNKLKSPISRDLDD